MWTDKFGEIWSDSFAFYNFTAKSSWDLVEFWFLFGAMAFFHETAHGLTCKHFGARVESMQFMLMYFAPTFMCDCTQVWIVGDKKARISTTIAGIWVDLMLCVVATIIWWGTATGMFIHDFAYKVMHGDRYRRDHPEPQPAHQAGRLLSSGRTDRRNRFEGKVDRLRLQLDPQTYFPAAG